MMGAEDEIISGMVEILIHSKWYLCEVKLVDQRIIIKLCDQSGPDETIPDGIRQVVIQKEDGQGLGISIKGGKERK